MAIELPDHNYSGTSTTQRRELANHLKDVVDVSLYNQLSDSPPNTKTKDRSFTSNTDFWFHLLQGRAHEMQRIHLINFHVMEWVPVSPGLFHTEDAVRKRQESMEYVATQKKVRGNNFVELLPRGKLGMIQGGLGSLKLASKSMAGQLIFVLCATSNGISHEGIPVVIGEDLYSELIPMIKENGSARCTLSGKLRILPSELSAIKIEFSKDVPKYVIFVDGFSGIEKSAPGDLTVSIAISYSRSFKQYRDYYSFCTFNPDPNDKNLKESVNWLKDYAVRYSETKNPIILADFDESKSHFEKVEFPISKVAKGKIPEATLKRFSGSLHFEINEIVMGDKFTNISNSKIINRSKVKKMIGRKTVKKRKSGE